MTADAVVAINGVWILVETYTLNSKICPDNINTRVKESPTDLLPFLLQVDIPGPDLFPGVILFSWPVSWMLS